MPIKINACHEKIWLIMLCMLFIISLQIHAKELMDNTCCLLEKETQLLP